MTTRIIAGIAAALALAAPAAAQDFNAAPPNGKGQQPAFPGQTRAPVMASDVALETQTVTAGLEHPWGMAELPNAKGWLVTERPGRLRLIGPDGKMSAPIKGLPKVDSRGQGGLLDVALAPDFAQSRRIFFSFSEPREDGKNGTAVGTGILDDAMTTLGETKVIFQQQPAWDSDKHFGSRLVFDREGMLFVTTGERSNPEPRQLAQDVTTDLGKVIRIPPDGQSAPGNPQIQNGRLEIYSYGHRNLQAAALAPDGTLWTIEHGPKGGDELNHIRPGVNYGWPIITYGTDYSGAPIGEGITSQEGLEQPVYYWDPVIGPSGMTFYDGAMFPEWKGQIVAGGLVSQSIVRLALEGDKVTGEARDLQGIGRVRDVAVAADGALMLLTDADDGALIRVTRK
ncbi:PQQ-dependent sugar dehydrogenase [Paracoccus suum]|nr:PQQ-dependent sugar dehydrogenase [Paracoccus suum]